MLAEYCLTVPSTNSTSYSAVLTIGLSSARPIGCPSSPLDRAITFAEVCNPLCGRTTSALMSLSYKGSRGSGPSASGIGESNSWSLLDGTTTFGGGVYELPSFAVINRSNNAFCWVTSGLYCSDSDRGRRVQRGTTRPLDFKIHWAISLAAFLAGPSTRPKCCLG